MRAFLAACLALSIVRTVEAGVEIVDARAEISRTDPERIEVYFDLRNDTTHELELLKAVSPRAERVEFKQRSIGADNSARLWPVAKFEIPAGGRLRLHADGRFFLLSGFDEGIRPGQVIPLTLTFEDESPVTLQLRVAPARQ